MGQTLESVQYRKELPDGTPILLSHIPQWEELNETQHLFLSTYFDYFPNESLTLIKAKLPTTKINKWKSNKNFLDVMEFIKTLHTDSLAATHFHEAQTNSKIRASVLKAMKAKGYEDNRTPSQHLTINAPNMTPQELAGLLKDKN